MKRMVGAVALTLPAGLLAGRGLAFGGGMGPGAAAIPAGRSEATPADPALANGEQIYFAGADTQGERVSYTGGPDFGGTPHPDGYSLDDFRQALVDGQDPAGEDLDTDMPRRQMSGDDPSGPFALLGALD